MEFSSRKTTPYPLGRGSEIGTKIAGRDALEFLTKYLLMNFLNARG
jgi:hypothetical protein